VKKLLLTTLVISSLSLSAQAQTSVVVYGLVDLGLAKSTDAVTVLRENKPSRLGFRGTEDLGNGLSAFFNLEIEIQADTGAQVGPLFNRQANVGLKGNFGSVALGRTKNLTDGATNRIDPFKTDGVIGKINENILRAGVGSSRVNNALTYNSPKLKGVVGSLQVVASEVSDADAGYNVLVAFDDGPISVHGSYARPVQAAPSNTEPDLFTVGAGYTIGPAKVTAAFARGETETAARGRFKGAVIGLTYQLGKTGEVLASAGRLEQTTATFKDRDTLKEFGIGYTYFLSKRTSLYAFAGNERVARIKSYQAGITHNF
jgi:predicted porin